jgi:RNA polymerase sigma-70 factor (ECF subfamily)
MTATDSYSKDIIANIPYLRAFARGLVKDRDLAEDVVQDTLVRALSCRSQFQPGTNLRGWLTVILRNRYFNLLRRSSNRLEVSADIEIYCGAASGGQEEALEWRDFMSAYKRLPTVQQKALALVGANGMSYEEAAQVTGCMVGTMKSRVSRARNQLHTLLDGKPARVSHAV